MDERDWGVLKDIFHRALECGPEERAKLLDEACAGRPEVRAELETLLRVHDRRGNRGAGDPFADPRTQPVEAPREIGEFRIVREIGRGGMGVVYEAVQVPMQRRVALKVLSSSFLHTAHAVQRFQREARAAGQLHHTNIVPIHAMGQHAGVWYYAMELVDGRPLNRVVAELKAARGRDGSGSVSRITSEHLGTDTGDRAFFLRVAHMFAEVADALETAHKAGVIHRDIKPSNLMLDASGRLMVVDFGLARLDDGGPSMTLTGDLVGTPAYMSPEQALARGVRVDHRTDIYSLGATLYEVLTLEPPYRGTTPHDICTQIVTRDPPLPGRVNRNLPKDLETVVFKAMEKDRDKRYATAAALGGDLRRFADGAAIHARRIGPVGRAWRKVKRHKVRSTLGAAAVILACLAGILGFRAAREAEQRSQLEYARLCALAQAPMRTAVMRARGTGRQSPNEALLLGAQVPTVAGNDARKLLTRAIALAPERFEAHLARALVPGSRFAERMEDLQRARARGLPARAFHIARAYLLSSAGEWKAAEAEQRLAAAYTERTPTGAYLETRLLGMTGKRDEARPLLEQVVRDAPAQSVLRYLALHHRARFRWQEGDFAGTLQDLTLVQGMGDDSLTTQVYVARCWRKLDNPELAQRLFVEARDRVRSEDTVAAWKEVCTACQGDWDWRDAVTREALERHADSVPLIEQRVYYFHQAGEFERARELCERALELAPDSATMYWLLGDALRELAQYDAALAALAESIRLEPSAGAFNARARVYKELSRYREALEGFGQAIELDPLRAPLHSNRGVVLRALGRIEEARAAYDRAIRLDVGYAGAYANRGGLLADEFDALDEALADFDRAIELDPRNFLAYLNRGTVLGRKGDMDAALEALDRAVELAPWRGGPRRKRAGVLHRLGRTEEAREEITEGLTAYPDRLDMLRECGHAYVDLGMHEEAAAAFRKAIVLRPEDIALYINCGASLLTLGRRTEALEIYEQAIGADPDDGWAHHMKAQTLRELGRLDDAVVAHRRAVELSPDDPLVWNGFAVTLLRGRKHRETLEICGRALTDHPDHARLHANRGIALQGLGQTEAAMEAYRHASELDETLWVPRWRLADLLQAAGRDEQALAAARDAARIIPDNAGIWNNIAGICLRLERWADAAEACRRALDAEPDRPGSHFVAQFNLGIALDEQGRYEPALEAFRRAADFAPRHHLPRENIGTVLMHMGKNDEAIAAFRKALELQPRAVNTLSKLGGLLDSMERHDEALEVFTRETEVAPSDPVARMHRGIQLHKLGRNEEAIPDLRRALELGGDAPRLHFFVGEALLQTSRYEEAERAYTEALRADASLIPARMQRAWLLTKLQRFAEALAELDIVIEEDPENGLLESGRAFVLASLGRFRAAEERLRRARELAPEASLVEEEAVWTLVLMGRFEDALAAADSVPAAVAARVHCLRALGRTAEARKAAVAAADTDTDLRPLESAYLCAVAGRRDKALELLESYDRPWYPFDLYWRARVHAVLGDDTAAIEWFGQAVDKGLRRPPNAAPDPDLAGLRGDPRFRKLLPKLHRRDDSGG